MDSIVALDIETTGLDPQKDEVIEIGAVRFKGHRVEGEWTTLIHPGKRIPPFITQLTGITDQMVVDAPSIRDVLPDLTHFIGNAPILGHNINFDLGFLKRHDLFKQNFTMDTYEMASVLLPNAGRYNLGALAQALGVPYPATHRAKDDAHATRGVFLRLYAELLDLTVDLLDEIVSLSTPIEWGGYWPFRMALGEISKKTASQGPSQIFQGSSLFEKAPSHPVSPLVRAEQVAPLDIDDVASILEPGGIFSKHFPNFEYRTQQVEMLRSVAEALSHGRHLMVEAGTGTGKSMAYLVPAALFALQNNDRVVISTNTINLQDQLINKDIPDLCHVLDIPVQAVVMKGRGNYLCPRRFEILRRRGPESAEEMRVMGKVFVWLRGSQTGDRTEINLNGPAERAVWSRISAENEDCSIETCIKRTGGTCPFYRVRQAAQSAHLIIVNHALLLADVATNNRVLPEYNYLIIDEAHHLEDATTEALSFEITMSEVDRTLKILGGPKGGTLGWLLAATQGILAPSDYASLDHQVQRTTDLAFRFDNLMKQFFTSISQFLSEQREGRQVGMYAHQERILPATRTQPSWGDVELAWDAAQQSLLPLIELLSQLVKGLGEIREFLQETDEDLPGTLTNLLRSLDELNRNIDGLVFKPSAAMVYWAEVLPHNNHLSLHAAPLHIGQLVQKYLWHEKDSVILTSATLTTAGEFSYIRGRLMAEEAYELALGSPFDYENSALLYLVNDISEPSDRNGHQRGLEQGLIPLCKAVGGRTLVLFTSYDQLKKTSQAIAPILAKDNILVYEQGEGASPHSLLETFRSSERAVLLGTRAFWEGVDIPGEALSVLVIAKLPFDVPSDPIVAARSETFEDPFGQYSLPEAILRFRQGFGRLIRTQFDRGVVAVFDKRVISKSYGRYFMDSLPTCTLINGPMGHLPTAASKWLNL